MKKINSGFSLIELLVVVAIIGVLAAIGTIGYGQYIASTKDKALEANMKNISHLLNTELSANALKDSADNTCLELLVRVAADQNKSAINVYTGKTSNETFPGSTNKDLIYKVAHNMITSPPTFTKGQYLLMCGSMSAKPEESSIIVCSCDEETCSPTESEWRAPDTCPLPQQNPIAAERTIYP